MNKGEAKTHQRGTRRYSSGIEPAHHEVVYVRPRLHRSTALWCFTLYVPRPYRISPTHASHQHTPFFFVEVVDERHGRERPARINWGGAPMQAGRKGPQNISAP